MSLLSINKIISLILIIGALLLLYASVNYFLFLKNISTPQIIFSCFSFLVALVQLYAAGSIINERRVGFMIAMTIAILQIVSFSIFGLSYEYNTIATLILKYNFSLNTISLNVGILEAKILMSWDINESSFSINFIAILIARYCYINIKTNT
jgi:hypothetical protein